MTWFDIVQAVRAKGYTGAATAAEIKAWATERNITLADPTGKAIDLDALQAKGKTVTIAVSADSGEQVEVKDVSGAKPEPEAEDDTAPESDENAETEDEGEKPKPFKSARAMLQASRKATADAVKFDRAPGILDSQRRMDRKAYAHKISSTKGLHPSDRRKAAFDDVDQAEFAGAHLRLAMAAAKGITYSQQANDRAIVGKASSETNNTSAGVLVAPEYLPNVLWLTENYGVARRVANVQRFSRTDEWRRPRKTSLLTMQYIGEGAQITSSDNSYDLVTLVPRKYGGLMIVSNELMDDSAVSVSDQFTQSVAEGQAIAEDQAYFNGDGTATYGNQTGLANALPSGAYIAAGATWAANTTSSAILPPGSVENISPGSQASWVMSRQAFYQVFGRLFNAGGGNRNIDLATYSLANPGPNGANASINGEPVYFSQVCATSTPASGTAWAYYGDFSAATMLGVHTDLRIASDTSLKFDYDQMAFRAISRFAVNIHGDGRGSTVGPIAALKTT